MIDKDVYTKEMSADIERLVNDLSMRLDGKTIEDKLDTLLYLMANIINSEVPTKERECVAIRWNWVLLRKLNYLEDKGLRASKLKKYSGGWKKHLTE